MIVGGFSFNYLSGSCSQFQELIFGWVRCGGLRGCAIGVRVLVCKEGGVWSCEEDGASDIGAEMDIKNHL